jgi:hypothetical protein
VTSSDSFPETEYLVPLTHVVAGNPGEIELDCSIYELEKMPVYDRAVIVPSLNGYIGSPYMMWPYPTSSGPDPNLAREHIPEDELVIPQGARVIARDGHVGRVDEFLVEQGTECITHLVMREGHLWGQKDVTIPVEQIDHYDQNTIYLKLTKQEIGELPTHPIPWGRVERR